MNYGLPVPKVSPRSDFRAEDFVTLIEGRGTRLLWERAEKCPCHTSAGVPSTDCPVCDGIGWEWPESTEIRGIVSGVQDAPRIFEDFGAWGFGVARISVRWEHAPSYADRFTLLDGVVPRQEVLKRAAVKDRLTFPIRPVTWAAVVNGVSQPVTVGVRHLRKQDAAALGGALLEEGVDFSVDSDGLLDWTLGDSRGTAPMVGQRYALTYYAAPRFSVIEHPFALRQTDSEWKRARQESEALPVSVLARLDWLPRRSDGGA